jgi:hypothetical protein
MRGKLGLSNRGKNIAWGISEQGAEENIYSEERGSNEGGGWRKLQIQ